MKKFDEILPWEQEKLVSEKEGSPACFDDDYRVGEYDESYRKPKKHSPPTSLREVATDPFIETVEIPINKQQAYNDKLNNAFDTLGFSADDKRYISIARSLIGKKTSLNEAIELTDKLAHPAVKFYINTIVKEFSNSKTYTYPNIRTAAIKVEMNLIKQAEELSKKKQTNPAVQKTYTQNTLV